MNKLTALSKLANAYHYVKAEDILGSFMIVDLFHEIREGLSIHDLEPDHADAEGYNGRMPTHF